MVVRVRVRVRLVGSWLFVFRGSVRTGLSPSPVFKTASPNNWTGLGPRFNASPERRTGLGPRINASPETRTGLGPRFKASPKKRTGLGPRFAPVKPDRTGPFFGPVRN